MTFQVTGMTGDTYITKDFMKVISLFYFSPSGTKPNWHTSPASDKKGTTLTIILYFPYRPVQRVLKPKGHQKSVVFPILAR
jgi:hypothetical protein